MAELSFTYGTMAAGKSTLALQLCWQLRENRDDVALWTFGDRSLTGVVTSRIGIQAAATSINPGEPLDSFVAELLENKMRILVVDEAQFCSMEQIDEIARLVDDEGIDVHAFGLSADFMLNVFPGSQRLFAISDRSQELPLTTSCWCGGRGRCNARVVNGEIARGGDQIVIGDAGGTEVVRYQVLCRRHYRSGELGR